MSSQKALKNEQIDEYASVEHILALYRHAPDTAFDVDWYATARADIQKAATELDISWSVFAGIVAAISPMKRWDENIRDAKSLVLHWQYRQLHGLPLTHIIDGVGGIFANNLKAQNIYETGDVHAYLRGPKVTQFWGNIVGVSDDPTIDSHACYAALGTSKRGTTKFGIVAHRKLAALYKEAANQIGVSACRLQEIVWVSRKWHLKHEPDNEFVFPNGVIQV